MKKFLILVLIVALAVAGCFTLVACDNDTIIVQTNAYFAPFEYYNGTEIVGVDVDIMNMVGEKLGKSVRFVNVEFDVIISNVSSGKTCDVGSAGITITDARKELVDFSIPYYTSVQYVIFKTDTAVEVSKNSDGEDMVLWSSLANKKIGVQRGTTGNIYVDLEINGEGKVGEEDYYEGELNGKGTSCTAYDSATLATDAINAAQVDAVVIDELPAKNIVSKREGYVCYPLYYDAETITSEDYAMCVPKGDTKYLKTINEVLESLLVKGTDGKSEMDNLVEKHFGV